MVNELVSIIIPVYNVQDYLRKCLDSVFNQTYKKIEVICINDGSTDNSLSILKEYKNKYDDKLVVKSIENKGQANARNIGIDISKGQYILFVDSDDTINKYMVEKMIEKSIFENVDIVMCQIEREYEKGYNKLLKNFSYDTPLFFEHKVSIENHPEILCFSSFGVVCKLIKKEFLENNNIRFIDGKIYEDFIFTEMMLSFQPSIVIMKEKFYKYYVRCGTTMTSSKSRVTDMFFAYEKVYNSFKEKNLDNKYKKELDFLCYYHVLIGTSFRMWKTKQYGLIKSILKCRKFVKRYICSKNNEYMKRKGVIPFLFVKIFG